MWLDGVDNMVIYCGMSRQMSFVRHADPLAG